MGNLLSGWMTKAAPTNKIGHASTSSNQPTQTAVQPEGIEITAWFKNGVKQQVNKTSLSDFERTFKPFNLKPNAQLAPINRFQPPGGSNAKDQQYSPTTELSPKGMWLS